MKILKVSPEFESKKLVTFEHDDLTDSEAIQTSFYCSTYEADNIVEIQKNGWKVLLLEATIQK